MRTLRGELTGCSLPLVSDAAARAFKDEFSAAGIDWTFHDYSDTPHGFALLEGTVRLAWSHLPYLSACYLLLPPTDTGYREHADRRSTQAMLALFGELFPEVAQKPVVVNAANTTMPVALAAKL
jgi:dienelactone hydrolase